VTFIRRAGEAASALLKRDFGTDDAPITPSDDHRRRGSTEGTAAEAGPERSR
jgi:hypothetical protein